MVRVEPDGYVSFLDRETDILKPDTENVSRRDRAGAVRASVGARRGRWRAPPTRTAGSRSYFREAAFNVDLGEYATLLDSERSWSTFTRSTASSTPSSPGSTS
ncbi:hypothetical protein [Nonomuraea africana]|uniref:Uncharacterized protein n=1 Tax=Nonomuraea africana TaxID=46171 RepID=A0ABR9KE32_9ACTN|nr:hypothetical protein [Nonomuraea africana]MBE1560257.1 hypothetical protein [Nonomuraea africana]